MQLPRSLEDYYADLGGYEHLTDEQQKALLANRPKGHKRELTPGEQKFITHHLRFVVQVAHSYHRRCGLPLEDRIGYGNVGLVEAVKRYNPDRGIRFISYAVYWIRQSIETAIGTNYNVKVPANVRNDMGKIYKTRNQYFAEHETEPSLVEVSKLAGIPMARVVRACCAFRSYLSLDHPKHSRTSPGGHHDIRWDETIFDPDAVMPDDDVAEQDLCERISDVVESLPEREARYVKGIFGFDGPRKSLRELGEEDSISRERVRQIANHGKEKLECKLRAYA